MHVFNNFLQSYKEKRIASHCVKTITVAPFQAQVLLL